MFTICRFKGNQMNAVNGKNLNFADFDELADHFDNCIQGSKHHSYWVRGELDPIHRKDDNLAKANIFVIDGDASKNNPNSAPSLYELHDLLTKMGINHFIYTTHSHNPPEKIKFRCVLECEEHTKQDIKNIAKEIIGTLNVAGYPIAYVKEMNTWSQPWFYPTRDDPSDGEFVFLKWTSGTRFKPLRQMTQKEVEEIVEAKQAETVEEMIQQIQSGVTYHAPLLALSYQYIKDGMNRKLATETLRAIMNACTIKDERWEERYRSIPGLVDGAISKIGLQKEQEAVEEIDAFVPEEVEIKEGHKQISEIHRPPGVFGDLVQAAFDQQILHSNIFAFASAMGLVAGIAGRTFNVSGTGLNIEMLVIARTGRGKDSIRKFITNVLMNLNEHGDTSSFIAPARFTGPVAMYNALKDSRSCVSVQTECGLIRSSEAGDMSGIVRYQLGLYSASGKNEFMGAEGYSAKDGSIQPLRAAAMSFIMESTAESFSSIFNNEKAFLSGELPRVGIYRETDFIPESDFSPKPEIPEHVMLKLKYLAQLCARQQARPTPDVIDLEFENVARLDEINKRWRDVLNEGIADSKALMATRNMLRTMKYAAIAAVMNNEPGDHIIHDRELEWANAAIEAEYASIEFFFRSVAVQGDIYDIGKRVKESIVKALTGYETGPRKVHDSLRLQGIMTVGNFKAICLNIKAVRDINDRRGGNKDGAQKVLDYFVANGYCTKPYNVHVKETNRTSKCIKFTSEFSIL